MNPSGFAFMAVLIAVMAMEPSVMAVPKRVMNLVICGV